MKLLQALTAHRRSIVRVLGTRNFAASAEEYARRNYASNISEYNTVLTSLTAQRRHFLLRDVYDDMLLDGVQPSRDTFHSLIVGTLKGARLQDAFFFRDEMKAMGLVPDVALYNFLISTCGKCKNSDPALRILEEMKKSDVKPNGQTYICLLNACAASGRTDRVYAIVRDMTAAGLGLNKFCYAGLIAAHRNKIHISEENKTPITEETTKKILELVEQSKGWSSFDDSKDSAENVMFSVSEEELYNIPTAEFVSRRGFLNRQLTVYHVAFHACADLQSPETTDALSEMLKMDNGTPDHFIVMQIVRCYLHAGDLDRGLKTFEEFATTRQPFSELYVTFIEGAMVGYTPRGMKLAQDMLETIAAKGIFLTAKMGSDLLFAAAGEKTGGYTTANYIWDLMQTRQLNIYFPAVEAYYKGLKEREIPSDDPRLLHVSRTYDNMRPRAGPARGAP